MLTAASVCLSTCPTTSVRPLPRPYPHSLTGVLTSDVADLMIEAKDKEQAVFHLYRIYGLQPVIHGARPPPPSKVKLVC